MNPAGDAFQAARAVVAMPAAVQAIRPQIAEVAGLAGDTLAVHMARAEYFALHGSYQRAIQHLEYARRIMRKDDLSNRPALARLEQRIIDLRTRLREARS